MAKKKKNLIGIPVRRVKEKTRVALRNFDLAMFGYFLITILCVLVGRSGDYDLGGATLNGFALVFLLIPAYLILELLSLINWIGAFNWNFSGIEAELLGGCDILLGIAVWIYVRWQGRERGVSFVSAARTFILIFTFWGVFQLGCCGALWLWRNGGFSSFNRHLDKKAVAAEQQVAATSVR